MVEYVTLQCGACKKYQVQQEKKAKRWSCVVCGAKQTLTKVWARGASAAMRPIVQKLNMSHGMQEQALLERAPAASDAGLLKGLCTEKQELHEGGWQIFLTDTDKAEVALEEEAARREDLASPDTRPGATMQPPSSTARKRRRGSFEDQLQQALHSGSSATSWKRMRVSPSTPHSSPVIKASSQPFTPPACPLAAAGSVPFAAEEDTSLFTDLPTWRVGARASGPKPAAARPAAVAPPPDPIDLFQTFTVHPEPKPIDEDSCPAPTGQQPEQGASWSQFV
ncbi:hypothetical protein DIPPA_34522 [Diplonema papillatum]|nr:hypothetical protein DIPPA_34522 [Diplonema papillatum]